MPFIEKKKYTCGNCGWSDTVFKKRLKYRGWSGKYYVCPECKGGLKVKKRTELIEAKQTHIRDKNGNN